MEPVSAVQENHIGAAAACTPANRAAAEPMISVSCSGSPARACVHLPTTLAVMRSQRRRPNTTPLKRPPTAATAARYWPLARRRPSLRPRPSPPCRAPAVAIVCGLAALIVVLMFGIFAWALYSERRCGAFCCWGGSRRRSRPRAGSEGSTAGSEVSGKRPWCVEHGSCSGACRWGVPLQQLARCGQQGWAPRASSAQNPNCRSPALAACSGQQHSQALGARPGLCCCTRAQHPSHCDWARRLHRSGHRAGRQAAARCV